MLAEDDPELRGLLEEQLEAAGHAVVAVPDGIDAMQFISDTFNAAISDPKPDLLITDVRMPRCDGVDLLAYTKLWRVPTIVVTAFGTDEVRTETDQLGAVAYFDKPFDIAELLATVDRTLATAS